MTTTQQNTNWARLTPDFRAHARAIFAECRNNLHVASLCAKAELLKELFGLHNLTLTVNPEEKSQNIVSCDIPKGNQWDYNIERPLKFRGKRSSNGEWVYGGVVYRLGNHPEIIVNAPYWDESGSGHDNFVRYQDMFEDTIGQYTGLKDRRGQEVYEGDVVFWIAKDLRGRGRGEQGAIIWDKHTMSWAILRDKPTSDGRPCIISRPFDKKHLEVVGNIYDNPELIDKVLYDYRRI